MIRDITDLECGLMKAHYREEVLPAYGFQKTRCGVWLELPDATHTLEARLKKSLHFTRYSADAYGNTEYVCKNCLKKMKGKKNAGKII